MNRHLTFVLLALTTALALPVTALAQDEAPAGWAGTTEATFVWTGGNAEASTLGFRVALGRDLSGGSIGIQAGGIRANSTTFTRSALGSPTDFTLVEESVSNLTAENYFVRLRYDRPVSEQLYWYVGIGWDRISSNTVFSSVLVVDQNLSETSDLRGNFVNSLSVAMSDRFAVKTSL